MAKFKVTVERELTIYDVAEIEVEAISETEALELAASQANTQCPENYRTTDPYVEGEDWYGVSAKIVEVADA